jgi:integrase
MTKKGRHSGSIIDLDGDGKRWEVRLTLGLNGRGFRDRLVRRLRGTHADATRLLNQWRKQKEDDESLIIVRPQTLDQWREEWLTKWCEVSARTLYDYRGDLARYLSPEIRSKKLRALTPTDVNDWVNSLVERGLSRSTVHKAYTALRACLEDATGHGKVPRNVVALVKLKKKRFAKPPATRRFLTEEEVGRFLVAVEGTRWEALFVLLVTAALRPGEAFALRWSDLSDDRLHIERAVVRAGSLVTVGPTKTKGERDTFLAPLAIAALRSHRHRQIEWFLRFGIPFSEDGLMFPNDEGRIADDRNIRDRYFRPALVRAELPSIRLYDLRHTAATLMYRKTGFDLKAVQDLLGHSSFALTMNTYTHTPEQPRRDGAERVNESLAAAKAAAKIRRLG